MENLDVAMQNLQVQEVQPQQSFQKHDFVLHKLDKLDYIIWKRHTHNVLEAKSLWKVVIGLEQNPTKEIQARALLTSALSAENQMKVISCNDASSIWKRLKGIHENKSSFERENLLNRLHSYKIRSAKEISRAVGELEMLRGKLMLLGESVSDEALMSALLRALPDQFKTFIQIWRGTAVTERTLENLLTRLMAEVAYNEPTGEKVLLTKTRGSKPYRKSFKKFNRQNDRNKSDDKNSSREDKSSKKCTYCNKTGHIKPECFSFKRKQGSSKQGRSPENRQSNRRNNQSSDSKHTEQGPVEVFMANTSIMTTWVVDGGSACHLCNNWDWLSNYQEYTKPVKVMGIGNNLDVEILGTGDVYLNLGIIRNVAFAPKATCNVLSESVMAKHGIKIITDQECIRFIRNERVMATAHLQDNYICSISN